MEITDLNFDMRIHTLRILGMLFILSGISLWQYSIAKRKRKFYHEECDLLSGKVVFWGSHIDRKCNSAKTSYDIDVLAENGKTYR